MTDNPNGDQYMGREIDTQTESDSEFLERIRPHITLLQSLCNWGSSYSQRIIKDQAGIQPQEIKYYGVQHTNLASVQLYEASLKLIAENKGEEPWSFKLNFPSSDNVIILQNKQPQNDYSPIDIPHDQMIITTTPVYVEQSNQTQSLTDRRRKTNIIVNGYGYSGKGVDSRLDIKPIQLNASPLLIKKNNVETCGIPKTLISTMCKSSRGNLESILIGMDTTDENDLNRVREMLLSCRSEYGSLLKISAELNGVRADSKKLEYPDQISYIHVNLT